MEHSMTSRIQNSSKNTHHMIALIWCHRSLEKLTKRTKLHKHATGQERQETIASRKSRAIFEKKMRIIKISGKRLLTKAHRTRVRALGVFAPSKVDTEKSYSKSSKSIALF
jgi:hypothetical protein